MKPIFVEKDGCIVKQQYGKPDEPIKTYFKVGDFVTHAGWGKGVVKQDKPHPQLVNTDGIFIIVAFGDYIKGFTHDGRYMQNLPISLHQGHIDIPEPVLKEIG